VCAIVEDEDGSVEALPSVSRSRPVPFSARGVPTPARPVLVPGVRTYPLEGTLRLTTLLTPPRVRREGKRMVLERTYREIAISGDTDAVWRVIGRMDGIKRVQEIADELPDVEAQELGRLVATLSDVGVVDASGRAVRRFLHSATTKPVLPGGPASAPDEVAALVTDGRYRSYPDRPQTPLAPSTPGVQLRQMRSITHARRSPELFTGAPIDLETISAVLEAACGVTAMVRQGNGQVALRAYPSSGALYAIEIYLHALATPGLEEGLYHYSPVRDALAHVRVPLPRRALVDVGIGQQRPSIASAGVVVFFVANFLRSERKYGSGGYRVLNIEAGHMSESVLLCACAAGLQGRPSGGWYEEELNEALGFTSAHERYLFSLLLGYASS
jgi:SagB-type dehydrogenase family enzyme